MESHHSELPKVWISYDHGPKEDGATFVDEGIYPPGDLLPFDPTDSAGVRFEMDGTKYELVGDFGGHAMYRRLDHKSSIYAMPWTEFARSEFDGIIDITQY